MAAWRLVLAGCVLAGVAHFALDFIDRMGYYRVAFNHTPGPCHRLKGLEHGSEDIQALPNGLALITSGYIGAHNEYYRGVTGQLFLFDFNNPDQDPEPLPIEASDPAYKLTCPHGLSIWTDDKTGRIYVYVVSHAPVEAVDKFEFNMKQRKLVHLKRFASYPGFITLNDLYVVAEDKFYFTNWVSKYPVADIYLGLCWASVGFFDGSKATLLHTGVCTPNGIALSSDGKFLYVANVVTGELSVYHRNSDDTISLNTTYLIRTALDNLDIDANGDIWAAGHISAAKALNYLSDPRTLSPSIVLRMRVRDGQLIEVEQVYANTGEQLSGSSVAVAYGKALLIGGIVTPAVYCELK